MSTKEKKVDVVATGADPDRAKKEALRGIKRNERGEIIRSEKWTKERIVFLKRKIEDFASRTKNAKAEIKALEKEIG